MLYHWPQIYIWYHCHFLSKLYPKPIFTYPCKWWKIIRAITTLWTLDPQPVYRTASLECWISYAFYTLWQDDLLYVRTFIKCVVLYLFYSLWKTNIHQCSKTIKSSNLRNPFFHNYRCCLCLISRKIFRIRYRSISPNSKHAIVEFPPCIISAFTKLRILWHCVDFTGCSFILVFSRYSDVCLAFRNCCNFSVFIYCYDVFIVGFPDNILIRCIFWCYFLA